MFFSAHQILFWSLIQRRLDSREIRLVCGRKEIHTIFLTGNRVEIGHRE
jgi:hypothetical protein